MSELFVSVIIPTYKDWDRLLICLNALNNQTYPRSRFEVVIVNNDPDEVCPFELPGNNMKIIFEESPGSYAARNAGIKIAKGEILAFTDSDCIPETNWLEVSAQLFNDKSEIDRVAGAVKIFPVADNPSYINKFEAIFAIRQDVFVSKDNAATANLFAIKSIFDKIGLFDGSLYSGGDCEWNTRATKAGFKLIYAPGCKVLHPARTKSQIIIKTKRLFPKYLELNTALRSKIGLLFYGFYLIKPPVKFAWDLMNRKREYNLDTIEMIKMVFLEYHIRFVRFQTHYTLLYGADRERR